MAAATTTHTISNATITFGPATVNMSAADAALQRDRLADARAGYDRWNDARREHVTVLDAVRTVFGDTVHRAIEQSLDPLLAAAADMRADYERAIRQQADENTASLQGTAGRIIQLTERVERLTALLGLAVADVDARCKRSRKELPAWLIEAAALVDPPI